MRAITVNQPYASQIVDGEKQVENRTWATQHRGPLLIHAGTRGEPEMPRGVLGVVLLVSVHPAEPGCCALPGAVADLDGEPVQHFVLEHPLRFDEPIPLRGRQMIFHVPHRVLARVYAVSPDWVGWSRQLRSR